MIAISIFLILLLIFLTKWDEEHEVKFKPYEAFSIEVPVAYPVHGIDVSRYQKYIGWEEVKAMNVQNIRLSFAFIKATEGENYVDPYFKRNWRMARKTGVVRGAYHFFIPSKDAVVQAKQFIDNVKLLPGDLPPVLDVEQTNNLATVLLQSKVKTWLRIVEAEYGVKPIIYTNADFYKNYFGKDFDEYPLWVAHYYERKKPRVDRQWAFWQHNDKGNVNGIDAPVDFNVFNGDFIAFSELLIK